MSNSLSCLWRYLSSFSCLCCFFFFSNSPLLPSFLLSVLHPHQAIMWAASVLFSVLKELCMRAHDSPASCSMLYRLFCLSQLLTQLHDGPPGMFLGGLVPGYRVGVRERSQAFRGEQLGRQAGGERTREWTWMSGTDGCAFGHVLPTPKPCTLFTLTLHLRLKTPSSAPSPLGLPIQLAPGPSAPMPHRCIRSPSPNVNS